MDALVRKGCQDNLEELSGTVNDYLTYSTTLWLTGAQGLVRRNFRLAEKWRDAQAAAVQSLSAGKGLRETARSQVQIVADLGDEWVEDVRNLAQVAIMNQAEMQHWSRRILRSSLLAVKQPC